MITFTRAVSVLWNGRNQIGRVLGFQTGGGCVVGLQQCVPGFWRVKVELFEDGGDGVCRQQESGRGIGTGLRGW